MGGWCEDADMAMSVLDRAIYSYGDVDRLVAFVPGLRAVGWRDTSAKGASTTRF